jgi:hypothetical protein
MEPPKRRRVDVIKLRKYPPSTFKKKNIKPLTKTAPFRMGLGFPSYQNQNGAVLDGIRVSLLPKPKRRRIVHPLNRNRRRDFESPQIAQPCLAVRPPPSVLLSP